MVYFGYHIYLVTYNTENLMYKYYIDEKNKERDEFERIRNNERKNL